MPANTDRKYKRIVSYIEDQVGADVNRDLLKMALVDDDLDGLAVDLGQIGGSSQSAVDVANQIDQIQSILSEDIITVSDDGNLEIASWNAGTLPTEQQSPVSIEDSTGSQIDPVNQSDTVPVTAVDSGIGSGNAASVDLGSLRSDVDIHVDTSGDATLTVEVSKDGGTWRTFEELSYTGASEGMEQFTTTYKHMRAYLDQNRNLVEISAKGVN